MWSPLSALSPYIARFFEGESPNQPKRQRVLVVGYGWGAHAFVGDLDRSKYDVQVVSERTARFNQPEMIRRLKPTYTAPPTDLSIIQDSAVVLDAKNQRIVGNQRVYPYDYAVIAVGSEANDFRVPGVREHCGMCKTEKDLEAIQKRIDAGAKQATVMGAGPTGLELACRLQGLGLGVTVLEAAPTILPGFSSAFQEKALRRLRTKGIVVRTGSAITEVGPDTVTLKGIGSVECAPFKIWTCGIQPAAFVRSLTGGKPLAVDDHLRIVGLSGEGETGETGKADGRVFGLGDCIAKPPPTAQNAKRQGEYLARFFNNGFEGKGYTFKELGRVLDMNDGLLVEVWGHIFFMPAIQIEDWVSEIGM
jgi:NADH dehydrogenase FAD-containing subunit